MTQFISYHPRNHVAIICRGTIVSSNLLSRLFELLGDEEFDVARSSMRILSALAEKRDARQEWLLNTPDPIYTEEFADSLPTDFSDKITDLLERPQFRVLALQVISSFSKPREL